MNYERMLYYLPLVHDRSESIVPNDRTEEDDVLSARLFGAIESFIESSGLDYGATTVYQDGLPYANSEEVSRAIDRFGDTPNMRIIRRLMAEGARVVGLEDPYLLSVVHTCTERIRLIERTLDAVSIPNPDRFRAESRELQAVIRRMTPQRNKKRIEIINADLGKNPGLLFDGLGHNGILTEFESDIFVSIPDEIAAVLDIR